MKRTRDWEYCLQMWEAFYIDHKYGSFAESYDAFLKAYPDCRDYLKDYGIEQAKEKAVKAMVSRFREADRLEHVPPPPTPPHLRDMFLEFDIDIPPMSASVSANDGQGRIAMADATPKQHRRHHQQLKEFHRRGHAYRANAEAGWVGILDDLNRRYPNEHFADLALATIIARLKEFNQDDEAIPALEAEKRRREGPTAAR